MRNNDYNEFEANLRDTFQSQPEIPVPDDWIEGVMLRVRIQDRLQNDVIVDSVRISASLIKRLTAVSVAAAVIAGVVLYMFQPVCTTSSSQDDVPLDSFDSCMKVVSNL